MKIKRVAAAGKMIVFFVCFFFVSMVKVQASALENLRIPELYRYGKGGGVNVAVIDRGFDLSNEELRKNLKGCYNAAANAEGEESIEIHSHGTNCAARILRVAPEVSLYLIQMKDENDEADWGSIERAVDWAIQKKCRIISISMYMETDNMAYIKQKEQCFLKAYHNNITVFCSAGNSGIEELHYPATYDSTISVCAATYKNGVYTLCSNTRNEGNDITAPGAMTSFATPFAAGVATLLLNGNPGLTPAAIKEALTSTALDLGAPGKDMASGYGLIQPYLAFQKVRPDAFLPILTVSLDPNGGNGAIVSKEIRLNDAYGDLPVPVRTGYQFTGWYTQKTGGTRVTETTKVTQSEDHTLYARWEAKAYTVSFDVNGGAGKIAAKTIQFQEKYGKLPAPTRTGYQFLGWYTQKTGGTRVTETTKMTRTEKHTLYARWKVRTYTVSFYANGGKGKTSKKTIKATSSYGKLPTLTRSGYQFLGWYTKKSGGTRVTSSKKLVYRKNHTLYARWNPRKYKVTFCGNRGKASSTRKTVKMGASYGKLPKVSRRGYRFLGWYTRKKGGVKITSGRKVYISRNHTLYAHWKKK